ncbi:hypothetical protein [Carboxylicivirga taeanensis]|uniref:hypothetical protein n=1 Tax=Carboxylicivirga taeanensis TaxID=1416875 RepID=UPI003F6DE180
MFTDSGGKITTIVESEFGGDESSPNLLDAEEDFAETSNENQDKEQFELSEYEKGILDEVVREMHSATPRQIRIYYYRYLLAKNILSKLEKEPLNEKEVEYLSRALNGRDKLEGVPKNERIEQVVDLVVTY